MNIQSIKENINKGAFDKIFADLYGEDKALIKRQEERYIGAVSKFEEIFPSHTDIFMYSAPGRTEIGGNHTDHQNGCVLAAAVNLDTVAVVGFHEEGIIRVQSEGYSPCCVSLDDLSVRFAEKETTGALIRGVAAKFAEYGAKIGGFDAYITSDVLGGSGLSSSAAFEVLLGTIIDSRYCGGKIGAVEIAKIGQYAENEYFGKASGLMDQLACSVGGLVSIDFKDSQNPKIHKVQCDFSKENISLCITNTKGSHAELTDEYSAIPREMKQIAACFGKNVLREVNKDEFYKRIPKLRQNCSDRAILRACHFFDENERALQEKKALECHNIDEFLSIIKVSGDSSSKWLQNIYSCHNPHEQGVALALRISEKILNGCGAVRVHGGGFAGTIQAFVPKDKERKYVNAMNELFGEGSCYLLQVRNSGGIEIIGN